MARLGLEAARGGCGCSCNGSVFSFMMLRLDEVTINRSKRETSLPFHVTFHLCLILT